MHQPDGADQHRPNFSPRQGDHFGLVGFGIIGIFALSWLTAAAVYRWKGYDRIELPVSN